MELIVTSQGFQFICASCMAKINIADAKRIGGKYYCKTCQNIIISSLTSKKEETTE